MSKVSNMNFYEKSLIYNYSTLYDIDFPQKIGFLRFFLRKFLLTVFNIIYGEYYFFNVQSFKKFLWKIWYKKIQHCETLFSTKNWIFAIFFKKVSIDGFSHYLWYFQRQKIGFLRFFLRKFLLTVFHIFHRKYTPNFQKIDFSIYPNILYIFDQNFMLVPTIKLIEFSDKNWETYVRLLIFWSIFWFFFLLSKVSKMKFYQKSLI